jgi:hypothetical protein
MFITPLEKYHLAAIGFRVDPGRVLYIDCG